MCAQFDLEVMCERSEKKRIPSTFYYFWNKEVHNKEHPQKKKNFDI
jgi:hypothetical protein